MTVMTLSTFDADMKDIYAVPGTRLKQWVVALRDDQEWEREACPSIDDVREHLNDSGSACSNHGRVQWRILDDHECQVCRDVSERFASRPDVEAFLRECAARGAKRSAIDRSLVSDEVQPDLSLRDSPLFSFLRGRNA